MRSVEDAISTSGHTRTSASVTSAPRESRLDPLGHPTAGFERARGPCASSSVPSYVSGSHPMTGSEDADAFENRSTSRSELRLDFLPSAIVTGLRPPSDAPSQAPIVTLQVAGDSGIAELDHEDPRGVFRTH